MGRWRSSALRSGADVGSDADFSRYWYESLCSTVRFDRAVVAAQKCGADAFIEMSAHPSLLFPLNELINDDSAVIVGSGHRDGPIIEVLSANIATAAIADPNYPWSDALPATPRPPLREFPNAPMRSVHLWAAPEPTTNKAADPGTSLTIAVEDWQQAELSTPAGAARCGIAIVGDAGAPVVQQLTAAAMRRGYESATPADAEIVAVVAPALHQLDAAEAVEQMAGRADAGLPDYEAIIGPRCRTVWLITAGGELVVTGDPGPRPAQAALAAMHRSVGFEFGDQAFGSLDLAVGEVDQQTAAAALDVLLGDAGVMALRNGDGELCRYRRTLREHQDSATTRPLDAATLENVVVTGGSGAIGMQYAKYCIERGARSIILLSRNGVEPEALSQLIGRHHVEVHAPLCDITDRVAVADVAAEYAGTGTILVDPHRGNRHGVPPFRAHRGGRGRGVRRESGGPGGTCRRMAAAAGMPDSGLLVGIRCLGRPWPRRVRGVEPDPRRAGRAAACDGSGLHGDSMGIVAGRRSGRQQLRSPAPSVRGSSRCGPSRRCRASLGRYADDPLIFDADFDRLRVFFDSQGIPMPFDLPDGSRRCVAAHTTSGHVPLAEVVRAELAATLHLGDSVSIDATASLIDLGLDSLLALDLRRRLRRTVGTRLRWRGCSAESPSTN